MRNLHNSVTLFSLFNFLVLADHKRGLHSPCQLSLGSSCLVFSGSYFLLELISDSVAFLGSVCYPGFDLSWFFSVAWGRVLVMLELTSVLLHLVLPCSTLFLVLPSYLLLFSGYVTTSSLVVDMILSFSFLVFAQNTNMDRPKIVSLGCFRMEKVDCRSYSTLAKSMGTIISMGGAFVVTYYKGPLLLKALPSASNSSHQVLSQHSNWVLGGLLLAVDCTMASSWLIVQVRFTKP